MYTHRKSALAGAVVLAIAATALTGCERGASAGAGAACRQRPPRAGCPTVLAKARAAVRRAEKIRHHLGRPHHRPHGGLRQEDRLRRADHDQPRRRGRRAGRAGSREGHRLERPGDRRPGHPRRASRQPSARPSPCKPSGIVIGGFDPRLTSQQVARADAEHVPLIGWHAVDAPGPSKDPELFSNITTQRPGRGEDQRRLDHRALPRPCRSRRVHRRLDPVRPAQVRTDQEGTRRLLRRAAAGRGEHPDLGHQQPHPPGGLLPPLPLPGRLDPLRRHQRRLLRRRRPRPARGTARRAAAPRSTSARATATPPPSSASTADSSRRPPCPSRFSQQGWQILDEFNRAFSGTPASGYVAPVHISTAANSRGATTWDPPGYRAAYRKIWGR